MTTLLASTWIKRCVSEAIPTRVYLKSGKCLVGTITDDDTDAFILSGSQPGSETLVYKDMVATIVRTEA